jgi:hypothetical protein
LLIQIAIRLYLDTLFGDDGQYGGVWKDGHLIEIDYLGYLQDIHVMEAMLITSQVHLLLAHMHSVMAHASLMVECYFYDPVLY